MRHAILRFFGVAAAVLLTASTAAADPIVIASGFLRHIRQPASSTVTVSLTGDNFTFTSATGSPDTVFWAWATCQSPVCMAASTLDIGARWSAGDLGGVGTHDGRTFFGGFASPSYFDVAWAGNLLIPPGFTGGSLSAPFTFTGLLLLIEPDGNHSRHPLVGSGTATLAFTLGTVPDFPGALNIQSLIYEFESPTPTPEPASLLLLSTGLAGIWWRRRGRRGRNR